jgi:hypothetical protein
MNNMLAFGISVIALVVALFALVNSHTTRYQITGEGRSVYRLDTATGEIRWFMPDSDPESRGNLFLIEQAVSQKKD